MAITCNNPQCKDGQIEVDPVRGDTICISCGTVLADDNIVSEVQFAENASGSSKPVGIFISSDSSNVTSKLKSFNGHSLFSQKSRDITLRNARTKIKDVVNILRLPQSLIDTALRFYKLGLNKGSTKGRKNALVIGACVYITCRMEATMEYMPMLIDVSDALQVDIYELGRTYLKLTKDFCITIPLMDPCFYILRFSYKLSFNEKTEQVAETATRLVTRMKRDWIDTGRRPSGICGAALVMAARIHNFNRTIHDVIKVVKIHESTLRKRLSEFGKTKSSSLTVEEFMTTDLQEEEDPPAFKAARIKEEEIRVHKIIEKDKNIPSELSEIEKEIEKELEEMRSKLKNKYAKCEKEIKIDIPQTKNKSQKRQWTENLSDPTTNNDKEAACTQNFITESTIKTINECLTESIDSTIPRIEPDIGIRPSAASLGLKDSIEDCMKVLPSDPKETETGDLDLTGIDDEEIDSYIMSEREISYKTKMWLELNKEYLEEQKLKEERAKMEAEQMERDGIAPKKKRAYTKRVKKSGPANTAGEAIENLIQERNLSSKINYDILKNLDESEDDEKSIEAPSTSYKIFERPSPSKVFSNKVPVETPGQIQSILQSLAGKKNLFTEDKEDDEIEEELMNEEEDAILDDDDDDEEEEEEEDDAFAILQKRNNQMDKFYN